MEEIEIALGKGNTGNYCCINISMADVFLQIVKTLSNNTLDFCKLLNL